MTAAAATPPVLPGAYAEIMSVAAPGAGSLTTPRGRYPLGALTYAVAPSGRGMLEFEAGAGAIRLSGADAVQTGPARYVLKIDVLQVLTPRHAAGTCQLSFSARREAPDRLACKGRTRSEDTRFAIRWRATGAAGPRRSR